MPISQTDPVRTPHRESGAREATFTDIAAALRTRWRLIATLTLLALVASVIFVNVVSPRYTGTAQVLLQTPDTYFTRPGPDRSPVDVSQQIDEQAVASQVQIVQSRDLAQEAIKQLGLVGNPEFDKSSDLLRRIMATIGLGHSRDLAAEDHVLDEFYDHLLVYPVGKSRVVSIEFRSRDAGLAARAANLVAELYLGLQEDVKKDLARSASTWLGSNIDDLRKRVADSEAKVEAYRSKSGLLSGSGTTTLSAQQLSDLSAQLSAARTAQNDAQAKAQLIRDMVRDGRGFEIPDVANNELIRRLIEQRINLRAQLALESRTLLPQHPRIKELNAQLNDLEGQIRGAAERTSRTLENDARLAGSRVQSLETAINQQMKVVSQANEGEVQLRALEREARIQRDQLESYLTRYREATVRDVGNAAPPDARIVSRAGVPQTPSFPKKVPIVILATLAAFVLSAGGVVAREILSSSPRPLGPDPEPLPKNRREEFDRAPWAMPMAPHPMSAPAPAERIFAETRDVKPAMEPIPDPFPAPAAMVDAPHFAPPVYVEPAHADSAPALGGETLVEPEPLPALPTEQVMSPPAPDARYDFGDLVSRLRRIGVAGRARRTLVAGVLHGAEAADVGRGLALALAATERVVVIEFDPSSLADNGSGLTDLVAGDATFAEVIHREPNSRLHRMTIGTGQGDALTRQPEGLDVVISALDQTYDWMIFTLFSGENADMMALLGARVDVVVIASNLEPANHDLVLTYESARASGVADVIVAREQMMPEADSEAA